MIWFCALSYISCVRVFNGIESARKVSRNIRFRLYRSKTESTLQMVFFYVKRKYLDFFSRGFFSSRHRNAPSKSTEDIFLMWYQLECKHFLIIIRLGTAILSGLKIQYHSNTRLFYCPVQRREKRDHWDQVCGVSCLVPFLSYLYIRSTYIVCTRIYAFVRVKWITILRP